MGSMLAIGLMSGTSRDGIDAALIETDGEGQVVPVAFVSLGYDPAFRARLADACLRAMAMEAPGPDPLIDAVTKELTQAHAEAVRTLIAQAEVRAEDIGIIGFHGHTVAHRPDRRWTWQIGDSAALAGMTGIAVVNDFRSADVAAGGQGAPLIPIFHRALAANLEKPVAVLNLGGVANITYIGADGELIAFDTGMASALIDNWVQEEGNAAFDAGGAIAATGRVDRGILDVMLHHPFFDAPPPKSLDREDFTITPVAGLGLADGAATLTAFSAQAVELALRHLPARPSHIHVGGGGRHNGTLMRMIAEATGVPVQPVDSLGWNGDAVEAQGFAYMAVRALQDLPISFPGTTGVPEPMTGGVLHRP